MIMEGATQQFVAKRVVIDLDRCVECRSCAAACYYSHANMPAVNFARAGLALLPLICRQCKAASCVEACPAEAMIRDEQGVVRRRLFRCIGCGSCARACPFGVIPSELGGTPSHSKSPERMSGHQVAKCDLCADRTESDPDAVPRCVAACPSGALLFADEQQAQQLGFNTIGGRTTGEPFKRR
jgi:formate dehydrogenase iron-sulfur subunit